MPDAPEPRTLTVTFEETPGTFVDVPACRTIWQHPCCKRIGVYLWCIEYESKWLVNYVGKASGATGFDGRLSTEFKDWKAGRYSEPVDIDAFKRGRRTILERYEGWVNHQLAELAPLYRVFLAPLETDADCRQVENTIVHLLRRDRSTLLFLANQNPTKGYRPKPIPIVRFAQTPAIIGLTAPIPTSLCVNAAAST
jgi:hypothetical protein